MKMHSTDITTFSKFSRYVKNDIPKLAHANNPIVKAIKKLSGTTSRVTIRHSLMWGNFPTIKIVPHLICNSVRAYGCYAWGGDEIQIDQALVQV